MRARFQSTHHLRDATLLHSILPNGFIISIHAPLAWCDKTMSVHKDKDRDFNPRTTCVMRLFWSRQNKLSILISIHAPLAWCDVESRIGHLSVIISIHAPLAWCDVRLRNTFDQHAHFNPRTTCVMRLSAFCKDADAEHFNPRTTCVMRPPPGDILP